MTLGWGERVRTAVHYAATGLVAVVAPLLAGYAFARMFSPTIHSRYFPWITARALGIAGYLSLWALVAFGIWMRHPWRLRRTLLHGETRLRVHAVLGSATIAIVIGHLSALATDPYAGVGWLGALVPGFSKYRTFAVSLGVVAFSFMVLLALTARFAGLPGTRHWLAYHRLASANFALVWVHGVLAGADTTALRSLYVVTGLTMTALAATRYLVAQPVGSVRREDLTPTAGRRARRAAEALR